MAAIAAADVTVTVTEKWRAGKKYWSRGTLAFGNGSATYSTAGIPLPAIGTFGFSTVMDTLQIFGLNARTTDYAVRWNKADHKLQLFEEEAVAAGGPLPECDVAEAPAARTYDFLASGY
jgi:hypothetical protein